MEHTLYEDIRVIISLTGLGLAILARLYVWEPGRRGAITLWALLNGLLLVSATVSSGLSMPQGDDWREWTRIVAIILVSVVAACGAAWALLDR